MGSSVTDYSVEPSQKIPTYAPSIEFQDLADPVFFKTMKECTELCYESWIKQNTFRKLTYAAARLVSSFL